MAVKEAEKKLFFVKKTKKNQVSAKTRSLSIGTFFKIHFDTEQDSENTILKVRSSGKLSLGIGSSLDCKYYTRLERLAIDKHSSIFGPFINYI